MSRFVGLSAVTTLSMVLICACLPLATHAAAQDGEPPNTIDCGRFVRGGSSWNQIGMVDFDFASRKHVKMAYAPIVRGSHVIDDYDLYSVLELKCGSRR